MKKKEEKEGKGEKKHRKKTSEKHKMRLVLDANILVIHT